jgi:hypothetical protein
MMDDSLQAACQSIAVNPRRLCLVAVSEKAKGGIPAGPGGDGGEGYTLAAVFFAYEIKRES